MNQTEDTSSKPERTRKELLLESVGIVGMAIVIFAVPVEQLELQSKLFFVGSLILFLTALVEGQSVFIVLQVCPLVGAFLPLLHIGQGIRALSLSLTTLGCLFYLLRAKSKSSLSTRGILGVILLGFGYAFQSEILRLAGGALITLYSLKQWKARTPGALRWAVLNGVFTVLSVWGVLGRVL